MRHNMFYSPSQAPEHIPKKQSKFSSLSNSIYLQATPPKALTPIRHTPTTSFVQNTFDFRTQPTTGGKAPC